MSISSAIVNAQQKVTNAYTAVNNKGGTLPATQDLSNLPTAISAIPTATEPTLASLTITPSTTAQTITPPSGTDGYNTVSVSAVTSSIDRDIQRGNIRSGVNILGVTGTLTALAGETRTVSITSTSGNTFTPSSGKNGITSIKCNPINKALTITPTTTTQTFTVPSGYSGYGTVKCNPPTAGDKELILVGISTNGVQLDGNPIMLYVQSDVVALMDFDASDFTHTQVNNNHFYQLKVSIPASVTLVMVAAQYTYANVQFANDSVAVSSSDKSVVMTFGVI